MEWADAEPACNAATSKMIKVNIFFLIGVSKKLGIKNDSV